MTQELINLLLVEDNHGDAELIQEMIAEFGGGDFEITHCTRLAEALDKIRDTRFQIVLSDLWLPDSYGLETFYRILIACPGAPVVVLSGNDDESAAIQAVHKGAQDYLVKGFIDGHQLIRSLRYAVARVRVPN